MAYLVGVDMRGGGHEEGQPNGSQHDECQNGKCRPEGGDLTDAIGTTNEQLAQARLLMGTTLPDDTVIEDEDQWLKFKAKYGGAE